MFPNVQRANTKQPGSSNTFSGEMKNVDRSEEKRKRAELIRLLKEGEDSGMIEDFDPAKFLAALHEKYKEG